MKAIDIDKVKRTYCSSHKCPEPYCMDDPYCEGMVCANLDTFLDTLGYNEIIEAIPVSYIMDRIRDTCGAEATYLGRLVTRYREGRYNDELGNS